MVEYITFYGTSAAIPSVNRGFSCIGLSNEQNETILLDCGDGSIRNLLKFGADVNAIKAVLFSHFHSDHVTGITQVIETMGIRKRSSYLHIFGPPGLKEYFATVQKITNVASKKGFQIYFTEIGPGEKFSLEGYSASTFKMDHTIPCLGYRLTCPDGKILAYTGDTQPCEDLTLLGKNADVFIHEATFLQKDVELARPPKHSTAQQAAIAARNSSARRLILTHVSDDNETPELMLKESRPELPQVIVASDALRTTL